MIDMSEQAASPLPIVPFLRIPAHGDPYLEGSRCTACGIHILERVSR